MTVKNYHSKTPAESDFKGVALAASAAEKASLPHPNSIRVGRALVHWVPYKAAWAAPYNLNSHPNLQWIHSRAEAKLLAERICLLLGK